MLFIKFAVSRNVRTHRGAKATQGGSTTLPFPAKCRTNVSRNGWSRTTARKERQPDRWIQFFFLRPTRARVSREILTSLLASPTTTSCPDSSLKRIREVGDHVRLLWILAARFAAASTGFPLHRDCFTPGRRYDGRWNRFSLSPPWYPFGFDGSNIFRADTSFRRNVARISVSASLTQNASRIITSHCTSLTNVL